MTATPVSPAAAHGNLSPYLPHIDPASRTSVNAWLASRDHVRFRVDSREFELTWTEPVPDTMQLGLLLTFGGRQVLLALDGFAAVDPLLVGDPFASVPVSLRDFVVARVLAQFLALLPSSLADAADLRAVHWSPAAFPRRDCVVGFTLTRTPERTQSRGILAADSAATLDWLGSQLPTPDREATNSLSALPTMMPVYLGSTLLSPAAIRDLEPGDVAWIETGRHRRDGIAVTLISSTGIPQWHGRIRRGGLIVTERCPTGTTLILAASPAVLGVAGAEGRRVDPSHTFLGESMNDARAALEIPVTFDLGQLTVPLRDLERLQPGHLFDLPCEIANATVNLRVSGTLVAEGTLVVIGKRLGIRIASVRNVE
jgi:type III secretion system YscQ/HrcQ family protein